MLTRKSTPSTKLSPPAPLRRLDVLAGAWSIVGRTHGATHDDVVGHVVISWLAGGFFLELRGEVEHGSRNLRSLEIVGYDAPTDRFTSTVYASTSGAPILFVWDVHGANVLRAGGGATFRGHFSSDRQMLSGVHRSDDPLLAAAGLLTDLDLIMTRVA